MALTHRHWIRGGRRYSSFWRTWPGIGCGSLPAGGRRSDGAREIGFTVLAISLSLVAVFTPILLMGGLVGRLFGSSR